MQFIPPGPVYGAVLFVGAFALFAGAIGTFSLMSGLLRSSSEKTVERYVTSKSALAVELVPGMVRYFGSHHYVVTPWTDPPQLYLDAGLVSRFPAFSRWEIRRANLLLEMLRAPGLRARWTRRFWYDVCTGSGIGLLLFLFRERFCKREES